MSLAEKGIGRISGAFVAKAKDTRSCHFVDAKRIKAFVGRVRSIPIITAFFAPRNRYGIGAAHR